MITSQIALPPSPAALPHLHVQPPLAAAGPPRPLAASLSIQAQIIRLDYARLVLRCEERQILDWIASGEIEWAFNLARADHGRRYIRILTDSVVAKMRLARPLSVQDRADDERQTPFPQVFDALFAPGRPWYHSSEVSRLWDCGPSHVHNLIEDGLLLGALVPGASPREGYHIQRASIAHFMQTRRLH